MMTDGKGSLRALNWDGLRLAPDERGDGGDGSMGEAQMEEVGDGDEDVEGDETKSGVDGRESGVRERP